MATMNPAPSATDDERVPRLRIGEIAKRTGVGVESLRAWERRYNIVEPARTEKGYRLYSLADERAIASMRDLVDQGIAPGQAAELIRGAASAPTHAGTGSPAGYDADAIVEVLLEACREFDAARAERALDDAIAAFSIPALIERVILPAVRGVGERWISGDYGVSHEHFASNLIAGRLTALARGWDAGSGPRVVLACAPGERHELGLLCFGLLMREQGKRITYLGADTPVDTLASACERIDPELVVVCAVAEPPAGDDLTGLEAIAREHRLLLCGGAAPEVDGAEVLSADAPAAARALAG